MERSKPGRERDQSPATEPTGRGRIKSEFPKHTLGQALRLADAIETANGGQPFPPTDLAIALGISPGSSDFRVLLSSSLKYGLTTGSYKSDYIQLESLGRNIVEPTSEASRSSALVEAALTPPTFRSIYGYFKGKKIPESKFFENTVVREFGVPREHAPRCVEIFGKTMEFVGLVRVASTGRWLSTTPSQTGDGLEDAGAEVEDEGDETGWEPEKPGSSDSVTNQDRNAIFVGHGKNKKPLEQLKQILDQYKLPYKVAIEEPNRFRPISEKVADIMKECGAAILIFTADEKLQDEDGQPVWRPSENVVFELGAASALYGGRIIIFKEERVDFPTNYKDIGYIGFDTDALSAKTNELFKELISFGLIRVVVGQ